ncbi:MAG: tetratricopeptide repeat protein, partial [Myxococcota bacterium]
MAFNKNRVTEAARRYAEKGQLDKAIKEYLKVVREDPKDVRVWLKIGDLYARKGDRNEAIETYLKVSRFYSEQGFDLKAVAVYKQILKLDPRLIEVNLKLAELYRQMGLMKEAMEQFEAVASHFHREGKTKEALATVRQLVDLDPENVATRIKLAELYSKEGMVAEAITEFTQACDYLRTHNRQDDFIKVAERLLWHKPDNLELSRELATLYLRRNDPRRALYKLQSCFKANSRDVATLALLAQAFQALGQNSKTTQVLKELARVHEEDGRGDQAAGVHRQILAIIPNDPDSLAYLDKGESATSQPAQRGPAQQLAVAANVPPKRRHNPTGSMPLVDPSSLPGVDFGPNNSPVLVDNTPGSRLGSELSEDSEYDSSVEGEIYSEEIAKILTDAEVYVRYGLHQKAIEHLRRVFDLDPDNIEAR